MNEQIKQLQQFLKTSPLGISYSGPVDGVVNDVLKNSAKNLQSVIIDKLLASKDEKLNNKAKNFRVMSETSLLTSVEEIKSIIGLLSKTKEEPEPIATKEEGEDNKEDENVKAIQAMFNSNPFSIKYDGPIDGLLNNNFISALQSLEQKIKTHTGADVGGKIVGGGRVLTNVADLQKTFALIEEYNKFLKEK